MSVPPEMSGAILPTRDANGSRTSRRGLVDRTEGLDRGGIGPYDRRARHRNEVCGMGDLIFWTALILAIFFGFRWLQKRNKRD